MIVKSSIIERKWFVFYTQSRQEKVVLERLLRQNFEAFLPLQKVMRQWSDRKKKVEIPLFNSYIFVCDTEDRIPLILQTPGIAWNIRYNGKPAVLHPKELEVIQRFISSGLLLDVSHETTFELGDQVEIMDGQLKGIRGHLVRTAAANRFLVSFDSFGASIQIEIDPIVLKKL